MTIRCLVLLLLLVIACDKKAEAPGKVEPLTVDPAEFRIIGHAGNTLPPDSGGYDYNYSILAHPGTDRIDLYVTERGTRPGNEEVDVRWMGELRGAEFEEAMALMRKTKWMRRGADAGGAPAIGGSYGGISVSANNGRYDALTLSAEWQSFAEKIEKRALESR